MDFTSAELQGAADQENSPLTPAIPFWNGGRHSASKRNRAAEAALFCVPAILLACATVLAGIEMRRDSVPATKGKLRIILVAVGIFLVSPFLVMNRNRTPVDLFELRKVVSIQMHWQKRTDVFAQPQHY